MFCQDQNHSACKEKKKIVNFHREAENNTTSHKQYNTINILLSSLPKY